MLSERSRALVIVSEMLVFTRKRDSRAAQSVADRLIEGRRPFAPVATASISVSTSSLSSGRLLRTGKRCRSRQPRSASWPAASQLTPGLCSVAPIAALRDLTGGAEVAALARGAACWRPGVRGTSKRLGRRIVAAVGAPLQKFDEFEVEITQIASERERSERQRRRLLLRASDTQGACWNAWRLARRASGPVGRSRRPDSPI